MRSLAAISGLSSDHFFMPGLASKYLSKLQPYFCNLKLHFGPSFLARSASAFGLSQPFLAVWQVLLKPSSGSPSGQSELFDVLVTAPVSLSSPAP